MKNKLKFYIGNHFDYGISDQLYYLKRRVQTDFNFNFCETIPANNFFLSIENFNPSFTKTIKSQNTMFGVVLTELMDFDESGHLKVNSQLLLERRTYIVDMQRRFFELIKCLPKIDFFLTLFNSPTVSMIKEVFPNTPVYNLCLWPNFKILIPKEFEYDYSFFGTATPYRTKLLNQISKTNSVIVKHGISELDRQILIKKSKFVLNLPQDNAWGSVSPMRVLSAHNAGRFIVNIGTDSGDFPGIINVKNSSELEQNSHIFSKKINQIEKYNKNNSSLDDFNALKTHLDIRLG